MATRNDRGWMGTLMALGALALPAAMASGCLGGPTWFEDVEDEPDDWWEDECAGMGSSGSSSGFAAPPPAADARQAIGEADIVKLEGELLYALSRHQGLTIIDASSPDDLEVLDQYDPPGESFEMYVREDMVYAMATSQDGTDTVVEALDTSNPSDIVATGKLAVPGEVSDSRIVGQVLYVVSFDPLPDGEWAGSPTTFVTAMSIADPAQLAQADQLVFPQDDPHDFGWKRSVMATPTRMYVAGVEWDGETNEGHSTIQVVDISDPTGLMVEGALVQPAGQIYSRWQMDEYDGVLRVISQPGIFSDVDVPKVETFSILSSAEVVPLGFIEMELAVPEALRAVRFAGHTAYAITAALSEPWNPNPEPPPPTNFYGDPLFILDLSNPAEPLQRGELEIPGWVYHMEVRGSRLLALGFDGTNPDGMLNVSLFDVANQDAPALIERVSFGSEWSGYDEDQNRIHKSFTILDDQGLIVVPYGDYQAHTESDPCWGSSTWYEYFGALQLIDFSDNSLQLRARARMVSQARRALIHHNRLLGMSDAEIRVFNIDDRDDPSPTDIVYF